MTRRRPSSTRVLRPRLLACGAVALTAAMGPREPPAPAAGGADRLAASDRATL